ncbi:MAG: hypothetical protein LBP80_05210 [Treponema sp.]|nr:hypothetical protein [Treponema sp.]
MTDERISMFKSIIAIFNTLELADFPAGLAPKQEIENEAQEFVIEHLEDLRF